MKLENIFRKMRGKHLSFPSFTIFRWDLRNLEWWWQRRTRGFDDPELWNLYDHLAQHILPRLKAYKSVCTMGLPHHRTESRACTPWEWREIQDKIIRAFELIVEDPFDDSFEVREKWRREKKEGLELFAYYFETFWD